MSSTELTGLVWETTSVKSAPILLQLSGTLSSNSILETYQWLLYDYHTVRHQLSILSPPTATILMEEDSHDRKYKIDAGQELALVCHGTGDPEPVLKWRREVSIPERATSTSIISYLLGAIQTSFSLVLQRKRLPDGRNELIGSQVIYQNVTRKHSGTYICEASNGPGQSAIDSVVIDVLREFCSIFSIPSFFFGRIIMLRNGKV